MRALLVQGLFHALLVAVTGCGGGSTGQDATNEPVAQTQPAGDANGTSLPEPAGPPASGASAPAPADSAPTPHPTVRIDRVERTGSRPGDPWAIVGRGFGEKAPALLWDMGSHAYEKGVRNDWNARYRDGDRILRSSDPRSVWKSVSLIDMRESVFMARDASLARHPGDEGHYRGEGRNAFLNNARVHPKDGTPVESRKLYVSWWYHQAYDTRYYYQLKLEKVPAGFSMAEGDAVRIPQPANYLGITEVSGRVIHYDPATRVLHAQFDGQRNMNRLLDRPIVHLASGLAAHVAKEAVQWNGSNKFIRVWESDGSAGSFRMSWTNTQFYVSDFSVWSNSEVPAGRWNHMELFVDQANKTLWSRVNGKPDVHGSYTVQQDAPGHSPTIGLIGFNASVALRQTIRMDDIYLDTSFRRVVLGNAPRHADVTHEELQRVETWTDTEIRIEPRWGALDRSRPAYLYVYDESNTANAQGVPVSY